LILNKNRFTDKKNCIVCNAHKNETLNDHFRRHHLISNQY